MSKQVVIIGGGVIGLSTALYCAQRGMAVTLIERKDVQRDGCSFGNAGMIVPSHFVPLAAPGMVALGLKWMWNPESPFYIKPRLDGELIDWAFKFWRASTKAHVARSAPLLRDLGMASRACFEELAADTANDFGLVKRGLLMFCKTQQSLDHEATFAAQSNALGVPAEVLSAAQAAALDPAVTLDIAGAVYFPKDCHLSPTRFIESLERQCMALGVNVRWNTEITGFVRDGQRIVAVETTTGEITGDEFVLCGGSWSPVLARSLGMRLPMQAGKGYSLTLPNPPQLPELCSIFTEARLAITPMGSSLRIGGTMEIAGLNEDISARRVRGIIKSVPHYFPAFEATHFDGIQPWCGLRPVSPDGMPYVGRTAQFANLSFATGHAMMGLSLGPITGKLMAETLSGESTSLNVTMLSPDRFA